MWNFLIPFTQPLWKFSGRWPIVNILSTFLPQTAWDLVQMLHVVAPRRTGRHSCTMELPPSSDTETDDWRRAVLRNINSDYRRNFSDEAATKQ